MKKIKMFFNKRNTLGILISGAAGFLVLTMVPSIGQPLLNMFNKLLRK